MERNNIDFRLSFSFGSRDDHPAVRQAKAVREGVSKACCANERVLYHLHRSYKTREETKHRVFLC